MFNPVAIFNQWLYKRIQSYLDEKVVLRETWELDKVEHKGIALPYVLLENKSFIINKFIIPIELGSIRLSIWNKHVMVGRVLFDGPVRIRRKSQRPINMEVRLSHITALFNLLRFFLTDTIRMDVRGEIELRILWMDFIIPVDDSIDIPRKKFSMVMKKIDDRKKVTSIPFEEIVEDKDMTVAPDPEAV